MEETSNQTSAYTTTLQTWTPIHNYISFELLMTSYLIFPVAVLGMCFAIYGIYSLFKTDQSSSVFVINLFICDLIQTSSKLSEICATLILSYTFKYYEYNSWIIIISMTYFYFFGVIVNIFFMVCISAERYIIIAHPVWYRTKHSTRKAIVVSVTVWITSVIIVIAFILYSSLEVLIAVFFLPYPLVIFFLVGTWRALSKSVSVPRNDQRRIIGMLALILCIHTVLFIPYAVASVFYIDLIKRYDATRLSNIWEYVDKLAMVGQSLITLNPLFDFVLYLLMRKDAKDLLCALLVCCRRRHEERRASETLESKV